MAKNGKCALFFVDGGCSKYKCVFYRVLANIVELNIINLYINYMIGLKFISK